MTLETIAFDIETTGFETEDQLTVVGIDRDLGSRVFLNSGEREVPSALNERVNEDVQPFVSLSTHDTERELLQGIRDFVDDAVINRDVKLVAYNGERWNGGFDLPFLRTRLIRHNIEWPFTDLPYIDVMDVFETQFNTSSNSLEAVYEELIGGNLDALDPFADSREAVQAWKDGDFELLIRHNIADIRRTRALMELAERYCSKSDFSMKSLSPVVEEI